MAPSGQLTYLERVVMEIVETERTYVRDLRMVVEEYLSRMIEHVCVRPELVCSLFGNIEDIYEFNSELLQDLELCDGDPVGVARCFVMKSEYFYIYTQYCTNYPNSVGALTECMRNKLLSKFLRERQTSLNRSLPLGSFLLKPVQRVLKYHLLLQEISKHFDPDHEGSEVVDEALHTMTGVAWYINDMKRKHEHAVRLQEVQSLLLGWKGSELTAYGELLLEGTFRVQRAKNRTLFLLERLLLISKQRGEHYVYKTHLSSSTLMLMQSSKDSLSFSVAHYKHPKQAHTIQARTVEEKKQWTHHIKRIIVENHHAIIPQKAKDAILEMDSVYPLRYRFSPERKKRTPQSLKLGWSNQRRHTSAVSAAEQTAPPQAAGTGSSPHPEGVGPKRVQPPPEQVHTVGPWISESNKLRHPSQEVEQAGPCKPAEYPQQDHEPLVDSDSKVLSSAESSEDEDGDGRDSSILPSSVLDRAGDIALHESARRGGVASEGSISQGAAASEGSQINVSPWLPSMLSRTNSANWTPPPRRRSSTVAPPCPPLSPPAGQSERRARESALSERDQLLIDRIKSYYENAANLDEAFTLRRRESLTFIPNGLVRDSVSRFTRNQDPEPHSEDPRIEPRSAQSPVQNQEQPSEVVFRPSSEAMKVWQQMELRGQCGSWTMKKMSSGPLSQNHIHQDGTTDRTNVKTTDRTSSQSVKVSLKDPEGVPPRYPPTPPAPRVQLAAGSDVSGTQRTVLSLARRFSQQGRTGSTENQQSVSSVKEDSAGTLVTDCVRRTGPERSDKRALQSTHARGHPPPSVEAFDWPDVRELRWRYDEHRNRLTEHWERRSSSCEPAPPQLLLRSCRSDPDLLHSPDRTGSVDHPQSHALQELQSSSENFVGFRVAAEAPLPTDPKHKILVLEKLPETSEEPGGAGENNSYVQIRSPTSREKISIMAVMERCRVYEDPEENRLREQSVVRNLREKFQSLS